MTIYNGSRIHSHIVVTSMITGYSSHKKWFSAAMPSFLTWDELHVLLSPLSCRGFQWHLSEFVAVMSRKVNASYTADQVKSAFKVRVPPASSPSSRQRNACCCALRLEIWNALESASHDRLLHRRAVMCRYAHANSLMHSSWLEFEVNCCNLLVSRLVDAESAFHKERFLARICILVCPCYHTKYNKLPVC